MITGFSYHITPRTPIRSGKPLLVFGGLIGAWILARIIFILTAYDARDILKTELTHNISLSENIHTQSLDSDEAIIAIEAAKASDLISLSHNPVYIKNNQLHNSGYTTAGSALPPKTIYPLLFIGAMIERNNALARKKISIFDKWDVLQEHNNSKSELHNTNDDSLFNGRRNDDIRSRLSFYGYIFGRSGSGSANALGARYGGSQAALQTAYRINPNKQITFDAVVRLQSAFNTDDKELAAGVHVRPIDKIPVSIIAEHRFRPSNADGFALYAAGGKSAISLPVDFKLNLYGQAGLSTAGQDTLFFDAQAVAERTVHKSGNFTLSAGGGAWAGGQRDAQRLDIGPSVSVSLSSGRQNFRLSGDWRERVGGNASPDSGVAITLSTDF